MNFGEWLANEITIIASGKHTAATSCITGIDCKHASMYLVELELAPIHHDVPHYNSDHVGRYMRMRSIVDGFHHLHRCPVVRNHEH